MSKLITTAWKNKPRRLKYDLFCGSSRRLCAMGGWALAASGTGRGGRGQAPVSVNTGATDTVLMSFSHLI